MEFRRTYGWALMLAVTPATVQAQDHSVDRSSPSSSDHSVGVAVIGNPGIWFGPNAYPAEAIRNKEQGRTVARIEVDATGMPSNCSVAVSSGSASLDARTCEIAIASLRFNPARDRSGTAIGASYTLPVRWVLPHHEEIDLTGGRHLMVDATAQFDVDEHGVLTACHTVSFAPGTEDPCAGFQPGRVALQQPVVHVRPVAGQITQTVRSYMDSR